MNPLPDLISRLQAATGPDRELDADISIAVGAFKEKHGLPGGGWVSKGEHYAVVPAPLYTGLIDIALTLLPDGMPIHEMGHVHPDKKEWYVYILTKDRGSHGRHAVPAIALLIAIFKAIAAKTSGEAEPP